MTMPRIRQRVLPVLAALPLLAAAVAVAINLDDSDIEATTIDSLRFSGGGR